MHLKLLCGFLLASIPWLHAQPNTIINDTFADGERLAQNLPASAGWYTGAAARNNLAVRNGALTIVANGSQRDVWGYFPATTLNIGDSITFTIDFRWAQTPPNLSTPGLRIALCNTNGQVPRRADGTIPSGGYQGYGSYTNPADNASGTNLRKRDGPAAASPTALLLELTDGDAADAPRIWNSFRTGLNGTQQGNIPYTASLKITRTGPDTANISTTISGGTLSPNNTMVVADTSAIYSTFDTVAIGVASSTAYGDLLVTRAEVVNEVNSARLINLSVRTNIPTSGDSFTLGYVVGGSGTSGPKPLVVRAAGPSLSVFGIGDALADPKLELFTGSAASGQNDDWGGGADVAGAMVAVGAFPFTSATSRDSAVLTNITARDNSVRVSANGAGTGTVIAEIYDASPSATFSASTPRLINVSVRKHLGTGLTVGFVVGGFGTKSVLVRAIGPALGAFGVEGVVADPQLTVFNNSNQVVATNDNWNGVAALSAAFTQVGAFPLPPTSRDAAVVTTLSPGSYTVQVSGVGNTTGVALVEVYEVQ